MKKLTLFLCSVLLSIVSLAQIELSPYKWSFMSDTNPFDGTYKSAFVLGTTDDPYTQTPILSVTKLNDNLERVYLSYFPGSLEEVKLYLRFDNETTIYVTNLRYDIRNRRYEINFDLFSALSLPAFLKKLKEHQIIHMRLVNQYMYIDVSFTLNEFEKNFKKL